MQSHLLVYPMFVMVVLSFTVLIRMFLARTKSVKEGTMDPTYYKTYQGHLEPDASAKLTRHFSNLFEAPVLFYAGCLAAIATGVTGTPFLVFAWLYVLLRMLHAFIHTGKNRIMPRIYAYVASWVVLLIMWSLLVYKVAV